ncbi:lipase family protein [Amycolatopsis stemonae]
MLRRLLVAVTVLFAVTTPVAQADPGVLLSAQPTTVFLGPFPAPVKAWHLLYRSTSATGEPNAVSGTLLVPPAPWAGGGPRPLITYAVGTHGLGDQCAPSRLLAQGTENESALLAQALSRGWAVVVTDYEGLGTPGTHTYAVGQSEGRAVLDAARAASRVPGAGLSPSGPVGVFGYSQGGQAAAFAAELQGSYAPSLHVVGVAAGGVPADLNAVFRANDGGAAFGLVLGAATGFAAAYPDVPFASILNDRGREAVARVSRACTIELGAAAPFAHLQDFVTVPDPIHEPHWQARLAANHLGTVAPKAPVFLYHGTLDELIPFSVGEELRDRWKSLGASVTWQEFPLLEHIGGVSVGGPVALTWLGTKF